MREHTGHALSVLEFPRVLEHVAARAGSEMARERIRGFLPSHDVEGAAGELRRVGAMMTFVEEAPAWTLPVIPDARKALRTLQVEESVLEPPDLEKVRALLAAARIVSREYDGRENEYPELTPLRVLLFVYEGLEDRIGRTVDEEGGVRDTASPELRRIRRRLRGAHGRVVGKLEAYLRTLDERFVVPDASVTVRGGRYVIPVRREGRRVVGGIVHDESHTGATLFVEPPLAVEFMNEIRGLEREERREVRRILDGVTRALRPHHHELSGSLDALVTLDTLWARARTAQAWGGVPPRLHGGEGGFRLVGARHPLLLESLPADEVVPYDLELLPHERALVVSGPNTGGKSVFLKAVGLIPALAQSGVVPPVEAGTELGVFASFFADIGDEQSIARNLSTFSAHLAHLSEIVTHADERSLVVMDEMGTGTDPAEGAALARAVVEELVGKGAMAFVSSHLSELKRLDGEGTGVVNASLQFDPERMEPTYHLVKGRPGRSYGLAIARRLGFPAPVLDRAESYRSGSEADLEDLLERLELREAEAARQQAELSRALEELRVLREEVEVRERALRDAEREAGERARKHARQELMEARAEVERAIAEVRAAVESPEELEAAAHRARSAVERAARKRAEKQRTTGGRVRRRASAADGPILGAVSTGDRVRVRATGATGTVLEVRSGRAVVEAGAFRMEVPAEDLEVLPPGEVAERASSRGTWSGPTVGAVETEIDLRGLRVDEVALNLGRALDRAVQEDLSEVRIIHGKGTGALRRRVGEILSEDPRVASFRMGAPNEGGAGVTVAVLR
ncbi:MAG: endonuclease MutS2 [Gemmatimonadota bacterium]